MIVQWFYTGCPHAVNPETSDVGRPLARLPSTVHPASVTSCNFSFLILKHMSSKSYLSVSSSWDKFSGDITVRRRTSSLEILSDHLSMHLILNIWRRNQISVACRRAFVFFPDGPTFAAIQCSSAVALGFSTPGFLLTEHAPSSYMWSFNLFIWFSVNLQNVSQIYKSIYSCSRATSFIWILSIRGRILR